MEGQQYGADFLTGEEMKWKFSLSQSAQTFCVAQGQTSQDDGRLSSAKVKMDIKKKGNEWEGVAKSWAKKQKPNK